MIGSESRHNMEKTINTPQKAGASKITDTAQMISRTTGHSQEAMAWNDHEGDMIILVNEADEEIGFGEKLDVHRKALLHRAFSLFVYDQEADQLLIHKRAHGKYHSGGLWTNACCSHPRKGEVLREAVMRRAEEELGIRWSDIEPHLESLSILAGRTEADNGTIADNGRNGLYELGKFQYLARYDGLAEHEIDHVFLIILRERGRVQFHPDEREISETRWVSPEEVDRELKENPDGYSAWFDPAYRFVKACLRK